MNQQTIEQKLAQIDTEIKAINAAKDTVHFLDKDGKELGQGNSADELKIPNGTAKIVANGDFKTSGNIESIKVYNDEEKSQIIADIKAANSAKKRGLGQRIAGLVLQKPEIVDFPATVKIGDEYKTVFLDNKNDKGGLYSVQNIDVYAQGNVVSAGKSTGKIISNGNIKLSDDIGAEVVAAGNISTSGNSWGEIISAGDANINGTVYRGATVKGKLAAGKIDNISSDKTKVTAAEINIKGDANAELESTSGGIKVGGNSWEKITSAGYADIDGTVYRSATVKGKLSAAKIDNISSDKIKITAGEIYVKGDANGELESTSGGIKVKGNSWEKVTSAGDADIGGTAYKGADVKGIFTAGKIDNISSDKTKVTAAEINIKGDANAELESTSGGIKVGGNSWEKITSAGYAEIDGTVYRSATVKGKLSAAKIDNISSDKIKITAGEIYVKGDANSDLESTSGGINVGGNSWKQVSSATDTIIKGTAYNMVSSPNGHITIGRKEHKGDFVGLSVTETNSRGSGAVRY